MVPVSSRSEELSVCTWAPHLHVRGLSRRAEYATPRRLAEYSPVHAARSWPGHIPLSALGHGGPAPSPPPLYTLLSSLKPNPCTRDICHHREEQTILSILIVSQFSLEIYLIYRTVGGSQWWVVDSFSVLPAIPLPGRQHLNRQVLPTIPVAE